jgi:xylulokinase
MVKRRTGAPFGDAVLAGVATGVFDSFDVTREWVELVDEMEPNRENHERYMELFSVYKTVYEQTKDQFKVLARFRRGE